MAESIEHSKLFRVVCRGMKSSYGISYVVATDPTSAYQKLKDYLDQHDLGFHKDREMEKIELIADTYQHGDCGTQLFL